MSEYSIDEVVSTLREHDKAINDLAALNKNLVIDIGALRFVVQALAELLLARARISPAEALKMIEPSIEKIGDEELSEQIREMVGHLLGARPGFRVIQGGAQTREGMICSISSES